MPVGAKEQVVPQVRVLHPQTVTGVAGNVIIQEAVYAARDQPKQTKGAGNVDRQVIGLVIVLNLRAVSPLGQGAVGLNLEIRGTDIEPM